MLEIGIVGLPNVGKSTLFNLLSHIGVPAQNYPFCTIDKNEAIVEYKDPVLLELAEVLESAKVVFPTFKFVDIAGLVKGASKGEGLGNQFLAHIREVDFILFVLRGFLDPNVVNVMESVDPRRDLEILLTELILKDLETVSNKLEDAKKHRHRYSAEKMAIILNTLENLRSHLEKGEPALSFVSKLLKAKRKQVSPDTLLRLVDLQSEYPEIEILYNMFLLTAKPFAILLNISYELMADPSYLEQLHGFQGKLHTFLGHLLPYKVPIILFDVRFLSELEELSATDKQELVADLQFFADTDAIFKQIIKYLQLKRLYVGGRVDARGFLVLPDTTIKQAAGLVHSDLEKGFIKARVTDVESIIRNRGLQGVHFETVGPDYVVRDRDYFIILANK